MTAQVSAGYEAGDEVAWLLIFAGMLLAVLGLMMVWAAGRHRADARTAQTIACRRSRRAGLRRSHWRGVVRLSGAPLCAAMAGGVIFGVQWALLDLSGKTATVWSAMWAVVLGVPAFLAGATVVRLLAVLCGAGWRYRQLRRMRVHRCERRSER